LVLVSFGNCLIRLVSIQFPDFITNELTQIQGVHFYDFNNILNSKCSMMSEQLFTELK
jgi:hypothetical protein